MGAHMACMVVGGHAHMACMVGGGACMAGNMHGRGNVWQGACMAGGGMHGRGVCVAGGCVPGRVSMAGSMCGGGVHGGGHAWQGSMCGGRGASMAYGQLASITHPSGMHSFLKFFGRHMSILGATDTPVSDFETQRRRHQKSKTGVSVEPQKGLMSSKIWF